MPWGCPLVYPGKLITPSLTGRLPLLGKPIGTSLGSALAAIGKSITPHLGIQLHAVLKLNTLAWGS